MWTSTTRGPSTNRSALIHLLQHTAGFDDMHFNEMYNVSHPADLPLADVLRLNPSVACRAVAARHADVLFEPRVWRGRVHPRESDR